MDGSERRKQIMVILKQQTGPISGTQLAKCLGVSRQVVVQDIAMIRILNQKLISTPKGYILLEPEVLRPSRVFWVKHSTEEIEDELMTIVSHGGKVLNVTIGHGIYGEIATDLIIETKRDLEEFMIKLGQENMVPLKDLAGGIHGHLVEARSDEILDEIQEALMKKKYLLNK